MSRKSLISQLRCTMVENLFSSFNKYFLLLLLFSLHVEQIHRFSEYLCKSYGTIISHPNTEFLLRGFQSTQYWMFVILSCILIQEILLIMLILQILLIQLPQRSRAIEYIDHKNIPDRYTQVLKNREFCFTSSPSLSFNTLLSLLYR